MLSLNPGSKPSIGKSQPMPHFTSPLKLCNVVSTVRLGLIVGYFGHLNIGDGPSYHTAKAMSITSRPLQGWGVP